VDIDYANFKDTVAGEQGLTRAHVDTRVWDDLWELQDERTERGC